MKTILFLIIVLYSFIGFAQEYTFRNGDSVKFEITPEGYKGLTLRTLDFETKEMSAHELIYSQGYLQHYLAEREGKRIFHEIEDLIYTICDRFWNTHNMNNLVDNES